MIVEVPEESSTLRRMHVLILRDAGAERAFYGQGCYFAEFVQHLRSTKQPKHSKVALLWAFSFAFPSINAEVPKLKG